jgi:hypothetical protein
MSRLRRFDAKFWLSPVQLAVNHGFRPHDLREIAGIIEKKRSADTGEME